MTKKIRSRLLANFCNSCRQIFIYFFENFSNNTLKTNSSTLFDLLACHCGHYRTIIIVSGTDCYASSTIVASQLSLKIAVSFLLFYFIFLIKRILKISFFFLCKGRRTRSTFNKDARLQLDTKQR